MEAHDLTLPQIDPIPENCVFKYSSDNLVRQDDLVIFWEGNDL